MPPVPWLRQVGRDAANRRQSGGWPRQLAGVAPAHFQASVDVAENYMKIAKNWDRVQKMLSREHQAEPGRVVAAAERTPRRLRGLPARIEDGRPDDARRGGRYRAASG